MASGQQDHSVQKMPAPIFYTVKTSSKILDLSGKQPFSITITAACNSDRPIWALISLSTPWCYGIQIRDPTRKNRKVGPQSTMIDDEWDEEVRDREDSRLIRLADGDEFELQYHIDFEPKLNGIRYSDVKYLTAGVEYQVTLGQRKWRWIFEDEMPEGISEEERRELLYKQPAALWDVDCEERVEAV